jgi:hypothetical protein
MKSYPLLQGVIEDLGFEVSFYREGEIMTTEYYDHDFPLKFQIFSGDKMPFGKSMYLELQDQNSFSLQYLTEDESQSSGKEFSSLPFNDTIQVTVSGCLLRRRAQ